MNSPVETYEKRLRDEVSLVEQEIEAHNQRVETLNSRLEGLKRALELCLELDVAKPSRASASTSSKLARSRKAPMRRATAGVARNAQVQRGGKGATAMARARSNGAMKRVDMITAVLKRHPRLTVRELIAALDREFGWECGESNLTAHLYTNRERFSHTKADRAGKQLVTWSSR